jgi:membrane protein DedA with SNARE-associated domain
MYFDIIPSLIEILSFLRSVYDTFGLPGLFVGSFLEGIAYLGLYFPGSLIIIVAAAFSNGTLFDFMKISFVITVAISLASIVNYYFGKYSVLNKFLKPSLVAKEKKKALNHNFIMTFFHPNLLAFYVYTMGARKESIWKLLLIPPIMFIWGILLAWFFYTVRDSVLDLAEKPFTMIILLLSWFFIAFLLNYLAKDKR